MNKFINPVQLDVAKSIPALQGVDMSGVKPFGTELQDSAMMMGKALGTLADTLVKTNEVKQYNDLMAQMDSINMDTNMQIQSQLGSNWSATEEGRNAALDIANTNIQKQRDLVLQSKDIYGEDKWRNIENYFKKNAYTQVQNLQGQVYQGYVKESTQKFALEESTSVARIGSLLGDSALNGMYGMPTDQIYTEMQRQIDLTRSNGIMSDEQKAQTTTNYVGTIVPMMINSELKTKIIDNTQNPAFYTPLLDKDGNKIVDENGNPAYVLDDAGVPIPNIEAKARAVNEVGRAIMENIKDGTYVEGMTKKLKLNPMEKDMLDSYLKTKGQEMVNKSIMQMNIAMGNQRKENEEKIMLIGNKADEDGRKAYNGVIESIKDNNNIISVYGKVSGVERTPTEFVSPVINPETGDVVVKSPLEQMTGYRLSDFNNNGVIIEGYVTKGQISKYDSALDGDGNPVDNLHATMAEDLKNYRTEDEKRAYFMSLGSHYNKQLSEISLEAIATDPNSRTPEQSKIANFVNDTIKYGKLYKFDYGKGVTFNDRKASEMYNELNIMTDGNPKVMDSVIKYIGSKALTPEFAKYDTLRDAVANFNNNKNPNGTVNSNTFTKAIVTTMVDDPAFRANVFDYINTASKAINQSRLSYSTYSLPADKVNTLAGQARDRAIKEAWRKESLKYKIPESKLREALGIKDNNIKPKTTSYKDMDSWN